MSGKIILNLAISLDGYIADKSGGFEWITGDGDKTLDTKTPFDFSEFLTDIDIIVMGGECYRQGFEKDYTQYKDKTVYIATSKPEKDRDNLHFINGDIVAVLEEQKREGKNIFLFGGGKIIDPFIKQNAIDRYIVGVIPTVLGDGRKLFLENNPNISLHLDSYSIAEGVVILIYSKR